MSTRIAAIRRTPGLRRALATLISVAVIFALPASPVHAETPTTYTGTLPNGATWIADVPADWNGTLLLYSHGYNPFPNNPPRNAPDPATHDALLARGYALAGSSYSRSGWVTDTAATDQIDTLAAVTALIGRPRHTIAYGTSFGGLITGQIAERARHGIHGAFATCGLMGGGIDLHNYQLDGVHAIAQLLLPSQPVKLVRFASLAEASTAVSQMLAALQSAQSTPEGRARVALITALFQEPAWAPGLPEPSPGDVDARQAGRHANLAAILGFVVLGRFDMEQSAGGNPTWNAGVDYGRQLAHSGLMHEVAGLYHRAGLDLRDDLALLTRTAAVTPDRAALEWMQRTSTVSGGVRMPVLTLHTTDDALVPVQHQEEYAEDVRRARATGLLRQAYTHQAGHCAFSPAEMVTGVETVLARVRTGRWGDLATPQRMQRLAESLGLGPAAFVHFRPEEFLGDHVSFPS